MFAYSDILVLVNWATVTVTDSAGKRYSLDVEAESTYDAAHLFLMKAKEHVIREPLPIPSLDTTFEVTVNGKVHKVSGAKLQRWILKRREEWKGPRGLLFKQRPILGP
jgi:hypothetical protein